MEKNMSIEELEKAFEKKLAAPSIPTEEISKSRRVPAEFNTQRFIKHASEVSKIFAEERRERYATDHLS